MVPDKNYERHIIEEIRSLVWGTSVKIIIRIECLLFWLRVSLIHAMGRSVSMIHHLNT